MGLDQGRGHLAARAGGKELKDQITPENCYLSRRKFIAGVGAAAAVLALSACTRGSSNLVSGTPNFCSGAQALGSKDELGADLTSCQDVTNYNNFYEFSYGKDDIAGLTSDFKTSPWSISIGGLVNKPGDIALEDLIARYQPQERIYRMRCVEAWSMVIPWMGFPLNPLLNDVGPLPEAKVCALPELL